MGLRGEKVDTIGSWVAMGRIGKSTTVSHPSLWDWQLGPQASGPS